MKYWYLMILAMGLLVGCEERAHQDDLRTELQEEMNRLRSDMTLLIQSNSENIEHLTQHCKAPRVLVLFQDDGRVLFQKGVHPQNGLSLLTGRDDGRRGVTYRVQFSQTLADNHYPVFAFHENPDLESAGNSGVRIHNKQSDQLDIQLFFGGEHKPQLGDKRGLVSLLIF